MSKYIIIDDNESITMVWELVAAQKNIHLITYNDSDLFKDHINSLDNKSLLYIDINLGKFYSGVELSEFAYTNGFKDIYLMSGYVDDSFKKPEWILSVSKKIPPF